MPTENTVTLKYDSKPQSDSGKTPSFCNLPLSMARQGVEVTVEAVNGRDDTRSFLANLGFTEGTRVSIVSELGGNVIVCVKDTRVAISRSMASRIITRNI
ncbi:MAG: ferrous iron transport protein A [Firmicutes bacterium HGW-Firmicutes-21]|nr:MAG: ferrous iron transport protein A [Firmicutes bacterium HGW-Firmicutes-21]